MPIPARYSAAFEPNAFYHIICKALPNQQLFISDGNKKYFLERYRFYLNDYLDTYCYNLLNNHCHFLVKVKAEEEIRSALNVFKAEQLSGIQRKFIAAEVSLNALIERQFNSFFVSYTRSFNLQNRSKRHLFDSPFRRILVKDEIHLSQLVVYIHANAVKHKVISKLDEYPWSSYSSLISERPTLIKREEVFKLFENKQRFISTHLMQTEYYYKFDD